MCNGAERSTNPTIDWTHILGFTMAGVPTCCRQRYLQVQQANCISFLRPSSSGQATVISQFHIPGILSWQTSWDQRDQRDERHLGACGARACRTGEAGEAGEEWSDEDTMDLMMMKVVRTEMAALAARRRGWNLWVRPGFAAWRAIPLCLCEHVAQGNLCALASSLANRWVFALLLQRDFSSAEYLVRPGKQSTDTFSLAAKCMMHYTAVRCIV